MIVHVEAYAKLNLSLRVVGIREDGFHEILSDVQTIDLADRLTFELGREGVHVEFDPPLDGVSTVERAAQLLLAHKGLAMGARIRVQKQVPLGAGLGGGSSDGAATLAVLDRLTPPQLPFETLCELGASIGSDVPLFLHGGRLRMGGRGETIERRPEDPNGAFLVVVPPVHCATAEIYARWDALHAGKWEPAEPNMGENDLLQAALDIHPELATAREAIGSLGGEWHGMSGSGAAFFAAFWSRKAAEQARCRLAAANESMDVFVCCPTDTGYRTVEGS